jgi:hypothetical protein
MQHTAGEIVEKLQAFFLILQHRLVEVLAVEHADWQMDF